MKRLRIVAALAGALAVVAAAGCAPKRMTFRPTVGERFTIVTSLDQDIGIALMGMNTSVKQRIVTDTDLDVLDRTNGGDVVTRFTIRRVRVHQDLGMASLDYDSRDNAVSPTPVSTLYGLMIDKDYRVTFNRNGGVEKVEGLSNLLSQATAGAGPQASMLVNSYFDDESMKQMMQGQWLFFPDRDLKVGDTWTRSYAITTGFPMRVDEKWTLSERRASAATFVVEGVIAPPEQREPFDLMGMTLILDNIRGRQNGKTMIDPRTGMAISSQVTGDLSTTMKIENVPNMPEGMAIPMTIRSTTTIEMKPR